MEIAVNEELVEHDRSEVGRHLGRIDPRRMQRRYVVDLDGGHVLQRQHSASRAFPDQFRNAHPGIRRGILGEPLRVRALLKIVDLLKAREGELLDEDGHVDAIRDEAHVAEPAGDATQRTEVDVDDRVDTGTLDLHDHVEESRVGSIHLREAGAVHLTEGCRRKRGRIDERERALEGKPELPFGENPDVCEGYRGNLILQAFELSGDLGRQHIEARRHELADLDHEAAEIYRKDTETLRDVQ